MKSKIWSLVAVVALVLGLQGCSSNSPAGQAQGGVILSITDFDGLPIQVSVNTTAEAGFVQIGQLVMQNIAANPTGNTSSLMDVEIERYEVGFTRADLGTRTPRPRRARVSCRSSTRSTRATSAGRSRASTTRSTGGSRSSSPTPPST